MLNFILETVRKTKSIVMDKSKQEAITVKGYGDYVTQVDFGVQTFLEDTLCKAFPHIQFMSEEEANNEICFDQSYWILDPIDGTCNLTHNLNQSAVSLALIQNYAPVLGVVYNPFSDDIYYAEKNKGAYHNGKEIKVSTTKTLRESLIHVGTSPYNKELVNETMSITTDILLKCEDIRRTGAAAIDLCHVAAGHSDGFFESILKPWDYAASVIILEEAGGKITNYNFNMPSFTKPDSILASNGKIHDEFFSVIKQHI